MGQVFPLRDFQGYTPVIDPRRFQAPNIYQGSNFYHDVDGPVSAFGGHFFDWKLWDTATAANVRELYVNGEIWYGTPTGVWRIDPITMLPELMIDVVSTRPFWPWTVAEIGGYWYFAQYNVGIYQYNPVVNSIAQISEPFGIVKGLCACYGRLVVIDDQNIGWSALDDGTNFTPSPLTGAGAQSLAILSTSAFRVDPIVDGVVISTDLGMIKGQRVDADYVFSWFVLSTEIRIFSPNMGIFVPDFGYLTLSTAGMHLTNVRTNYFSPQASQPYEPAMSEYLRKTYVDLADRTKDAVISLYYSSTMRMVFVAIAPNANQGSYQTTFCFYLPSGKWGKFDHTHSGIVEFTLYPTKEVTTGYMSPAGYFKWFDQITYDEQVPTGGGNYSLDDFVHRQQHDPATLEVISTGGAKVYLARSTSLLDGRNPTYFNNIMQTGVYALNSFVNSDETIADQGDIVTVQVSGVWIAQTNIDFYIEGAIILYAVGYAVPQAQLNSYLQIGPLRAQEQREADETSAVTSLLIGTVLVSGVSTSEDYNAENSDSFEDYNTETPDSYEDYNSGVSPSNSFAVKMLSTDDGATPQIQGWETLLQTQTPGETLGSVFDFMPAGYSAVYHLLQISTVNVGDFYNIKFLDVSAMPTGRLV